MSTWPDTIARKVIAEMQAYSARGGATTALHLDANESPWTPPPSDASVRDFNRYPAQQPEALLNRMAGLYGVSPERLMIGRGADEAIDVLMRTFCEAGKDKILICPPTFGYFTTAALVQGAAIVSVPLRPDFSWDFDSIRVSMRNETPKIVFLCSPNNPTGNSLPENIVEDLCADFPETLIVVDEAYIEFSDLPSYAAKTETYRNLVVLRTLSKAYSLAGIRIGGCIADPAVISLMRKVLPPYPIPRPVETATLRALSPTAMPVTRQRIATIRSERERLAETLPQSQFVETLYPSDSNFLLFKSGDPEGLLKALSGADVKIRDFRKKIPGHFRISVGSPEENNAALSAFGVLETTPVPERTAQTFRRTNETDIAVSVNLDRSGAVHTDTGIGFFDHMLEQIGKHGGINLDVRCEGDTEIDCHHTVEDVALALGTALKDALGNKAGIGRYGFSMPMDETLAQVAIDLSGRPAFVFTGDFPTDHVGEFSAEMCPHFFQSLSQTLGAAIHINVSGDNTHHMIEACFKGVGRALRPAFTVQGSDIPSTKGTL